MVFGFSIERASILPCYHILGGVVVETVFGCSAGQIISIPVLIHKRVAKSQGISLDGFERIGIGRRFALTVSG